MSEIWAEKQEWERKKHLGMSVAFLICAMLVSCFIVLKACGSGARSKPSPIYFSESLVEVQRHLDFDIDLNYSKSKFDNEFIGIADENLKLAHAALAGILSKDRFGSATGGSLGANDDEMCGGRSSLWHDGFSGLVLARWEPYLAVDMLAKWFSMQSVQGQIPSHQNAALDISAPPSLVLVVRQLFQMPQVDASAPLQSAERINFLRAGLDLGVGLRYRPFQWQAKTS